MKNRKAQAIPVQAHAGQLTQAEYHAVIHEIETVMKIKPVSNGIASQQVYIYDSVLYAPIHAVIEGSPRILAVVHADYNPLFNQSVTMAFETDRAAIKKAKGIRGAGDVRVCLQDSYYHIQGDHTGARLNAIPMLPPEKLTLPIITWIGSEVVGYDSKDLRAYINKEIGAVYLAIYGKQLEKVVVKNADAPYTFTPEMAKPLADRRPNLVLLSRVSFRFIGPKQTLRLGKVDDHYVLCSINSVEIGVDVVITEKLDIVQGS